MLFGRFDPNRFAFGNHMFVLIQKADSQTDSEHPYVLDACAGPQLGTLKVEDYIAACIDLESYLYISPPMSRNSTHDEFTDMQPYQGVSDLAISTSFFRKPSEVPKNTLFDLFLTEFQKKGGSLQIPYVGSRGTKDAVVATYTYTLVKISPTDKGETATFNFFRFETDIGV